MKESYKRFKVKIEGPNISRESFSWPEYKQFTEALGRALCGMRNGPKPTQIITGSIYEGSAEPEYEVPDVHYPAVIRLAEGPKEDWTAEENGKVLDLQAWLKSRNAGATIKSDGDEDLEFALTARVEASDITALENITGIVTTVGGKEAKVHIEDETDAKIIVCDAGAEVAEKIAQLLYHKVSLAGKSVRDGTTLKIKEFQITDFFDMGHRDEWRPSKIAERQYAAILRIKEILKDSMKDFDPEEYIRDIRND